MGDVRVFRSLEEARGQFGPCAVSIGNFDGVHTGHQSIFHATVEVASRHEWTPAVMTFDPHPTRVVAPQRAPRLLSTVEQRLRWMAEVGIRHVLVLPFTPAVAALGPEEFAERILVEALDTRAVLVGDNFRFGRKQAGDVIVLQALGARLGFTVYPMDAMRLRGVVVSSSEIRRLLEAANVSRAARLLGRCYAMEGTVVPGHGVGARQTVPTLNLAAENEVVPARGVYVSRATDLENGRVWPSITNIGFRPTFDGDRLSIETFLLEPLEGESPSRLRVELAHRVREERRFESPAALKEQILRDANLARRWHRRRQRWCKAGRVAADAPVY